MIPTTERKRTMDESKPRASGDDPVALWGELLKDL